MSNSKYNISAIQGSTLLLNIYCRNADNSYINLSGYNARAQVRYQHSSTGVLLNLNAQPHSSMISGLILVSGSADDIANLPVSRLCYDIEISGSDGNGYCFKPIRGYFDVEPEYTR